MHKGLKIKLPGILTVLIAAELILFQCAWANPGNSLQLLSPAPETHSPETNQLSRKPPEPFVNRSGKVILGPLVTLKNQLITSTSATANRIAFKGMKFFMTFFPGEELSITVDSESRPADKVIVLGGHINKGDISTFTMTITQESFLITYQDLENTLTYRVVGNLETGLGKVVEIDLRKVPPRYDSEPIVPEGD